MTAARKLAPAPPVPAKDRDLTLEQERLAIVLAHVVAEHMKRNPPRPKPSE